MFKKAKNHKNQTSKEEKPDLCWQGDNGDTGHSFH